ncbi:hypothetical protein CDHC01_1298 [Corynebacterium diphtheriae HC01]|nr:hypothetical protein CDBH8_1346 [Corynebacterium diphtheriae BH8]AEX74547.1 hypothetical protein CDHC01_1298 [Corynebacterium diphtheriae HC01]
MLSINAKMNTIEQQFWFLAMVRHRSTVHGTTHLKIIKV